MDNGCTALITHGVGRKQTNDLCERPVSFVTVWGTGFCSLHGNTKAGRAAQRMGNLKAVAS